MNVAAIAADEARSTIIIDTDSRTSPVAAALRIHAEPGLADVLDRRIDWAEVTSQATVGRDRVIDVLPSGITPTSRNPARGDRAVSARRRRESRATTRRSSS